jgi:hypothetical protein
MDVIELAVFSEHDEDLLGVECAAHRAEKVSLAAGFGFGAVEGAGVVGWKNSSRKDAEAQRKKNRRAILGVYLSRRRRFDLPPRLRAASKSSCWVALHRTKGERLC